MVEICKTHWMDVAEELFFDQYENPKEFYETFNEPVVLYQMLAWVACENILFDNDMTAYKMMYEAYATDQTYNNHVQLNRLVKKHKEGYKER